MPELVLIVDDDPIQRRLLDAHVARMGFRPVHCDGGRAAMNALRAPGGARIAAVVLDLMMPDKSGIEVMGEMRRAGLDIPVVVQTAKGGIDTVVEAMRAGAFDFVVKPVSPERLQSALASAIRVARSARAKPRGSDGDPGLLRGAEAGAALLPVLAQAAKAAASTIPLLIEGETGVGKEWLARAIRAGGDRARAPFVTVNCGALPSALVESILFGHAKGAFTDAAERHDGKFVEARGGTLFLDEVGELAPEAQVKLLRVLQDGEVDPVGARTPVRTDVRVISATNRDLWAAVAAGRFREDLFYRLNVLAIRVPPLRERRDEVQRLVQRFLAHYAQMEKSPVRTLSPAALSLLLSYDWPGNIRQLENAIHRAVVLAEDARLQPSDFPQILALLHDRTGGKHAEASAPAPLDLALDQGPESDATARGDACAADAPGESVPLRPYDENGHIRTMEHIEADLIRLAIRRYDGRMSEIARRLGIGRSTLYRKMREHAIRADASSA